MKDKISFWKPGDHCLLRGINRSNVCCAHSVFVVKDTSQESVLVVMPGAECALPAGYWARKENNDFSNGSRWVETRKPGFIMKPFIWQTKLMLMIMQPEKYYATYLFWRHETNEFAGYYINFQLPFRRVATGFDTLDLDIDIVIHPDGSWHWKDVEEYQQGIREGGILPAWVKAIEDSQPEVFAMMEKKTYPMDDSWLGWKPDTAWKPGKLVEGWSVVNEE